MTEAVDSAVDPTALVKSPKRLAAVHGTGLLDTAQEPEFDRLTRLAARLVGAPVTFISLVDGERDFYKSCFGFGEPLATERQLGGTTFCHYAIANEGPLIIPDTRAHPVYRHVPTVESLGVAAYVGVPLRTDDGKAIGSFCAIDFRPREWSDEAIETLQELAASTMREISLRQAHANAANEAQARAEITAIVSHDLRNPLHTIRSAASTLAELPLDENQRARFLQSILRAIDSMDHLIQDLLDASRVEAGRLHVDPQKADLRYTVRETVGMLQTPAQEAKVDLSCDVPDDLPPAHADADRIAQLLSNLIGNAVKFTPAGGSVRVTVRAADDERIELAVVDSGVGIDPASLPHIFERFWQGEQGRTGLGLGLVIVKGIVDAHGGTIDVESAPGEGTTFRVLLPTAAAVSVQAE